MAAMKVDISRKIFRKTVFLSLLWAACMAFFMPQRAYAGMWCQETQNNPTIYIDGNLSHKRIGDPLTAPVTFTVEITCYNDKRWEAYDPSTGINWNLKSGKHWPTGSTNTDPIDFFYLSSDHRILAELSIAKKVEPPPPQFPGPYGPSTEFKIYYEMTIQLFKFDYFKPRVDCVHEVQFKMSSGYWIKWNSQEQTKIIPGGNAHRNLVFRLCGGGAGGGGSGGGGGGAPPDGGPGGIVVGNELIINDDEDDGGGAGGGGQSSCTIVPIPATLFLGNRPLSLLPDIGDATPAHNLVVDFRCPPNLGTVNYRLQSYPVIINPLSNNALPNTAPFQAAEGVSVQVLNVNGSLPAFNVDTPLSEYDSSSGGTYSRVMQARMLRTGTPLTAGNVSAQMQIVMTYQ